MPIDLSFNITEQSGVVIEATFTDVDGSTIPVDNIKSITWTLKDVLTGNIVNNREDVSVDIDNPVYIFLSDDDLAIVDRTNKTEKKELIVTVIYDSEYKTNAKLNESCLFKVDRLTSG